jgi:hypothetical protein
MIKTFFYLHMVHFHKYSTYRLINRMDSSVCISVVEQYLNKKSITVTIKMHVGGIKMETAILKTTICQFRLYLNYLALVHLMHVLSKGEIYQR